MYKCLKKNVYNDEAGYRLICIRQEDIELIRLWRNDQINVLDKRVSFRLANKFYIFKIPSAYI